MDQLVDSGPQLLLDWREPDESGRYLRAGVGTVLVHLVLLGLFLLIASLPAPRIVEPEEVVARKVTPLIAPHFRLTQKEPNQGKPVKQVRIEDLMPKPQIAKSVPTPPVAPKQNFEVPVAKPQPPAPKPGVLPPPPESPKYEASIKPPQALPAPVIAVPPPQIQPEEKPKLAFENPGQSGTSPTPGGMPKIPIPKASVEDAIHSVARGGGGSAGVSISDVDQMPNMPSALRRYPSQGRMQSSVQLLSDPMGVDFKPYLIRVLSMVKRNWFAVYPESARLGLRGTVALRFWVDRSGQVPHLEIAMPSGATALDRAAVASISASVPLPPLPSEFKGNQITLQFSFQYN